MTWQWGFKLGTSANRQPHMRDYNIYRIQTILGLFQAGIVVFGSLLTGVMLKAMGYPDRFQQIPFKLLFVRNWGFLLIAIPLAWAVGTIWMERNQPWHTKRWTLASGLCLSAWLVFFIAKTVGRAGSTLITVSP